MLRIKWCPCCSHRLNKLGDCTNYKHCRLARLQRKRRQLLQEKQLEDEKKKLINP